MMSRKKRRGIIEKRRRDRINTSLSELRRLVPTAYEKQGSAKLEKAEILQMTVDHLKMLHSKGLDALAYDPSKFAMDYHNIGFRECAAEVARYLVSVEGLDIQDPLRLRLMSHLQCFATQREFASKQPTSTWYPSTNAPSAGAIPTMPGPTSNINPSHNYHQSGSSLSPIANSHSHHSHISAPPPPPPPPPIIHPPPILPIGAGSIGGPAGLQHHNNSSLNSSSSSSGSSLNSSNNNSHSLNNSYENGTTTLESTPSSSSSGNGQQLSAAASSTSTLTPLTTVSSISANDGYHQNYHQHHQHHTSMELSPYTTAHHHLAGIHQHHNMHLQQQTHHHPYSQPGNDPSGVSSQMKPYRPWGAELAY